MEDNFVVILDDGKILSVEVEYDIFSNDFYNPSHCEIEIINCKHMLIKDDIDTDIDYIPSNNERIEIIDDITFQIFNMNEEKDFYDNGEF